jgi:hypothetical protein
MTLAQWADNGWLRPHRTSAKEIRDLLNIVARDLKDADGGISTDWQFGIAYNAALKLCTVLLYASGYRAERNLQHYRTLQALPLILGPEKKDDALYLDKCRAKRNTVEYEHVGAVTETETKELLMYVKELRRDVMDWISKEHPDLYK